MIAIVNVGPHDDHDPLGVRTYEVRINAEVIATFRHARREGLGRCLLEAAKAVERKRWADSAEMLKIINQSAHEAVGARWTYAERPKTKMTDCDYDT